MNIEELQQEIQRIQAELEQNQQKMREQQIMFEQRIQAQATEWRNKEIAFQLQQAVLPYALSPHIHPVLLHEMLRFSLTHESQQQQLQFDLSPSGELTLTGPDQKARAIAPFIRSTLEKYSLLDTSQPGMALHSPLSHNTPAPDGIRSPNPNATPDAFQQALQESKQDLQF